MQIRPETPEDRDAVFEVERTAFGDPGEAILVDRLREAGQLAISLVAIVDGRVVGHVAFSPITLPDAPAGAFMAMELRHGALGMASSVARHHPVFDEV